MGQIIPTTNNLDEMDRLGIVYRSGQLAPPPGDMILW
jgi:hypothetical protein